MILYFNEVGKTTLFIQFCLSLQIYCNFISKCDEDRRVFQGLLRSICTTTLASNKRFIKVTPNHRIIILLERACLHNRIGRK